MSKLTGLVITKAALDNLEGFPFKIRAQLIKKAKALILDPHPAGSKPLKGIKTADDEIIYRQRSGDYRILYVVDDERREVTIFRVQHRRDVYR